MNEVSKESSIPPVDSECLVGAAEQIIDDLEFEPIDTHQIVDSVSHLLMRLEDVGRSEMLADDEPGKRYAFLRSALVIELCLPVDRIDQLKLAGLKRQYEETGWADGPFLEGHAIHATFQSWLAPQPGTGNRYSHNTQMLLEACRDLYKTFY